MTQKLNDLNRSLEDFTNEYIFSIKYEKIKNNLLKKWPDILEIKKLWKLIDYYTDKIEDITRPQKVYNFFQEEILSKRINTKQLILDKNPSDSIQIDELYKITQEIKKVCDKSNIDLYDDIFNKYYVNFKISQINSNFNLLNDYSKKQKKDFCKAVSTIESDIKLWKKFGWNMSEHEQKLEESIQKFQEKIKLKNRIKSFPEKVFKKKYKINKLIFSKN